MQGRYGVDQFARFTLGVALFVIVIGSFLRRNVAGGILDTLGFILIIYTYFRIFSRNVSARYAENQKYLGYTQKVRSQFAREKNMMEQRKTHHIYTCPGCGQKIRIPRGKGQKVEIECPKCHEKFIQKTLICCKHALADHHKLWAGGLCLGYIVMNKPEIKFKDF